MTQSNDHRDVVYRALDSEFRPYVENGNEFEFECLWSDAKYMYILLNEHKGFGDCSAGYLLPFIRDWRLMRGIAMAYFEEDGALAKSKE